MSRRRYFFGSRVEGECSDCGEPCKTRCMHCKEFVCGHPCDFGHLKAQGAFAASSTTKETTTVDCGERCRIEWDDGLKCEHGFDSPTGPGAT